MSLNQVLLTGNLTRDPELTHTPKGTAVCKLGVACNRTWKDAAGEKKEEVTFLDVEAWGRTAEVISQHFRKGSPIFVQGRLKTDSWDDKQSGQKRTKLKIVLEAFEFMGGRKESGSTETPRTRPAQAQQSALPSTAELEGEADDVPF